MLPIRALGRLPRIATTTPAFAAHAVKPSRTPSSSFNASRFRSFTNARTTIPKNVLTERVADRPLPDVAGERRKIIATIPVFIGFLFLAGAGFFNYQKLSTSVVNSTLYSARVNEKCRELLGDEIQFRDYIPWIWGTINQLQGKIDIEFAIKGTRDSGTLRFKCKRYGGKGGHFETERWEIVMSDGRVYNLMEGTDPMEGGQPIKAAN